jgi:hypothetical protein
MQKQSGLCAYSNACIMPGPRHRMEGTNREFCQMHFHALEVSAAAVPMGTEFARTEFHPPRSRRSRRRWPLTHASQGSF